MRLTPEQENILEGKQGKTRQKAIRLLIDLGKAANAEKLVPVTSAHVSGVSPLTGGISHKRIWINIIVIGTKCSVKN